MNKYLMHLCVRGWSGEYFFGAAFSGTFDAAGDFHDDKGIWIARKEDNANHPAFV